MKDNQALATTNQVPIMTNLSPSLSRFALIDFIHSLLVKLDNNSDIQTTCCFGNKRT